MAQATEFAPRDLILLVFAAAIGSGGTITADSMMSGSSGQYMPAEVTETIHSNQAEIESLKAKIDHNREVAELVQRQNEKDHSYQKEKLQELDAKLDDVLHQLRRISPQ